MNREDKYILKLKSYKRSDSRAISKLPKTTFGTTRLAQLSTKLFYFYILIEWWRLIPLMMC